MKALLLVLAAVAVIGVIGAGAVTTHPRQGFCLGSTAQTGIELARLKRMMSSAESGAVEVRDSLAIAAVPDSTVVLVQSDSVCAGAAATYRAQRGESHPYRPVWVFELGSLYYAALDPNARVGEWGDLVIMSRSFVFYDALAW